MKCRSLKRSSKDTDHYFRSLRTKDVDHYFRSLKRSPARSSAREQAANWMKRSSEEHDSAGRRAAVGEEGGAAATGFDGSAGDALLLPPPGEDEIFDMCVKVARDRLRRDERGRGASLGK